MPSPHCSPCKARLLQTTATALTPPNHKFLTTQCHIQKKGLKSNQVTENKHRQDKKKIGNVLREVSLQTSQFVVDIHPASHCTVTKEKMDYQGSAPTFSYWAAGGWGRGGGGEESDRTSQSQTTLFYMSSHQLLHMAEEEPGLYRVLIRQASPGQQFLSYTTHTSEISIDSLRFWGSILGKQWTWSLIILLRIFQSVICPATLHVLKPLLLPNTHTYYPTSVSVCFCFHSGFVTKIA